MAGGSIVQMVEKSMGGSEAVKKGWALMAATPSGPPPSRSRGSTICKSARATRQRREEDEGKARAYQQLLDQVLGIWWKAERELILEVDDLLKHEVLCTSLEGRPASKDLVEDAAEAPVVGPGGKAG